jgi:NitT/TauT family transport system substrate-binding protein
MGPLRIVEPFRTVFYAPQYVAHGLGLFEREGVSVELATATAPNGVAGALVAGEAELGLSGPIRALEAADRGRPDLVCLAEVNSRAGFFLLAPAPADGFAWGQLAGRRVLVFAEAPTPRLCLEYLLERHGVSPGDVDLAADLPAERAAEAFLAGRADYLLQGQPLVERLVATGRAHVAAALGPALGPVAFSAWLATRRGLAERAAAVAAALRALCRAQRWVAAHGPAEIAGAVTWAFPGLDRELLGAAVARYLATRTWAADPVLRRPGFDALQEILLHRGFIRRRHAYDALVDTGPAEAAVRAVDTGG